MKSFRKDIFKDIISWMFATPAALSVIAKLDERLDFAIILERIIINFQIVSRAFWIKISTFISIDLSGIADQLTFVVLLMCPFIYEMIIFFQNKKLLDWDDDKYKNHRTYFWVTVAFLLAVSIIFDSFVYLIIFVTSFIILLLTALVTIFLVIHTIIYIDGIYDYFKINVKGNIYDAVTVIGVLIVLYFGIATTDFIYSIVYEYIMGDSNSGFLINYLISFLCVFVVVQCLLIPTTVYRIGFWVLGILLVNYIATTILPALNSVLDGIII